MGSGRKRFLDITRPMYKLIKEENDKPILFEQMLVRQKAFKVIKAKLVAVLMVAYSNFDKLFILYTDVLGEGIGVILN